MTGIIKYCPWCDYNHPSLRVVHEHMDRAHPFFVASLESDDWKLVGWIGEDGIQ